MISGKQMNWVFVAIAVLMLLAYKLEASDIESEMQQERREWAYAVQHCHRAFGPSTVPEYDEQDRLVCVSRRGERLAFAEVAK